MQKQWVMPMDPAGNDNAGGAEGAPAEKSIEALFRDHNDLLLRFLKVRLGNEADARDAAQEAYVRLLQLDQPDRPSVLRAYLFKIAANVATDALRRRRTRNTYVSSGEAEGLDPALQERALVARQEIELIERALRELPPKCRAAFLLSRREGWSVVQIAAHLNVSGRMVRSYLVRAVEHLQVVLAEREGETTR